MKHTRKQIIESIKYWKKQLDLGNYKKINESDNEEFEEIDDIVQWCKDKNVKWKEIYKTSPIKILRKPDSNETITTVASDGTEELKKKPKPDEWLVCNEKNEKNFWLVREKVIKKDYLTKDGEKIDDIKIGDVYKPKNKSEGGEGRMYAPIADYCDKGVKFAPPNWGGDVITVKNNGYFMKVPSDEKDIYGISIIDFETTYAPEKKTLNESKIADFFGKLFKTKKFLAKQAEIEKAAKDKANADFMKKHPLAAVAKKMSDRSPYLMIRFTNADIENNGYPINASKKADCIVVRYVDGVTNRYDDMKDEKEKMLKLAKACGCSDDCEFYVINDHMAVIMPKLNEEWYITQVNED